MSLFYVDTDNPVEDTRLGYLLGLANDVGPGGSSVVWRYHHQCSHHTYCNDPVLDQDAHSSFPAHGS